MTQRETQRELELRESGIWECVEEVPDGKRWIHRMSRAALEATLAPETPASPGVSVRELQKIGEAVHQMGLTGFTYWFEFQQRLNALLHRAPIADDLLHYDGPAGKPLKMRASELCKDCGGALFIGKLEQDCDVTYCPKCNKFRLRRAPLAACECDSSKGIMCDEHNPIMRDASKVLFAPLATKEPSCTAEGGPPMYASGTTPAGNYHIGGAHKCSCGEYMICPSFAGQAAAPPVPSEAMRELLPKHENMKWLLDASNQVISELRKQEHLDSDTFRWLCNAIGQVERDLKRAALATQPAASTPSEPTREVPVCICAKRADGWPIERRDNCPVHGAASKPGQMRKNINDSIWVRLTEDGELAWEEYYEGTVPRAIRDAVTEGEWLRFQIWELISIFGKNCYNGSNKLPFKENIIALTQPEMEKK